MAADGKVNILDKVFTQTSRSGEKKEVKIPIVPSAYHHPYFKLKNKPDLQVPQMTLIKQTFKHVKKSMKLLKDKWKLFSTCQK